jgi:ribonuclease T2
MRWRARAGRRRRSMRTPQQLSLPGLLVLIAVALALAYFERQSGGDRSGGQQQSDSEPPQQIEARNTVGGGSNAPGDFDYYALVLSWSPTHCATPEGQDDETQCGRGRRYGFILHGLWPQYTRGYPEDCPTRERPYVPQPLIDRMMDIMPSKRLIIHEYRKHGTCSGLSPEGYFQTARRLFASLKIPDRFRNPQADQYLAPRDVVDAFVSANPELEPAMLAVSCRGSRDRFRELHVCFSKTGELRRCGSNENQGGLCRSRRMYVPPVR